MTDQGKKTDNARLVIVAIAVFSAVIIVVFWQALLSLHIRWLKYDEAYSHGYMVIVTAIYLIWLRLPRLQKLPMTPSYIGLAVVILGAVLWCIGNISFTEILQQLALPVILWGMLFSCFGWPVARCLLVPIGFIYFAIPVWDVLIYPLQTFTTDITSWWLTVWGVPAFIDGFQIHLPAGVVEVAGGCSGLNYLMVGIVVGFCYSELILNSKYKVAAILIAAVLSVVANWVRVTSLVMIAYYTEMEHPLIARSHVNFGWYIFAVALLIYFILMNVLGRYLLAKKSSYTKDDYSSITIKNITIRPVFVMAIAAIFTAVLLPVYVMGLADTSRSGFSKIVVSDDMPAIEIADPAWLPEFKGYDRAQQWRVTSLAGVITVMALSYSEQYQGKELVFYQNKLIHEAQEEKFTGITLPSGQHLGRSIIRPANVGGPVIALWTYQIGNWYTTSPTVAKLLQVPAFFLGRLPSAYIVFLMPCELTCEREIVGDIEVGYVNVIRQWFRDTNWDMPD